MLWSTPAKCKHHSFPSATQFLSHPVQFVVCVISSLITRQFHKVTVIHYEGYRHTKRKYLQIQLYCKHWAHCLVNKVFWKLLHRSPNKSKFSKGCCALIFKTLLLHENKTRAMSITQIKMFKYCMTTITTSVQMWDLKNCAKCWYHAHIHSRNTVCKWHDRVHSSIISSSGKQLKEHRKVQQYHGCWAETVPQSDGPAPDAPHSSPWRKRSKKCVCRVVGGWFPLYMHINGSQWLYWRAEYV